MTSSGRKRWRLTAAALGAALALGACETTRPPDLACDFTPYLSQVGVPGPAVVGPLVGTMTAVPINTVRVVDGRIANKILPQSVAARRTETGTVQVRARFANCTDFPQQVQARTLFLDEANFDAEPPTNWKRLILPPRGFGEYAELSTDVRRVANFTVELREGD